MEKPAETSRPIHDLLRRRWSHVAYAARSVEREKITALLEAARWAPSCFNEQPWAFLVATRDEPEEYEKMLGCLVEANQDWAKAAPVLMISVAKLHFGKNDKPNRHAYHDVGLAVENLVIQATSLGLGVHQMAGFDLEKTRSVYGIPAGFDPVAAIAIGYPGEPDQVSGKLREREIAPRTRKGLAEFVFSGSWGKAAGLVE